MTALALDMKTANPVCEAATSPSLWLVPAAKHAHDPAAARLTMLERSVVALARNDTLATLRAPGRFTATLRAFLRQNNPRLADERLEALRRMAVLAWHHSFQVPMSELRAFFDAGFSVGQYEAVMGEITATRAAEPRRR